MCYPFDGEKAQNLYRDIWNDLSTASKDLAKVHGLHETYEGLQSPKKLSNSICGTPNRQIVEIGKRSEEKSANMEYER